MAHLKPKIGQKLGVRTVISIEPPCPRYNIRVKVECQCGRVDEVYYSPLARGRYPWCRDCGEASKKGRPWSDQRRAAQKPPKPKPKLERVSKPKIERVAKPKPTPKLEPVRVYSPQERARRVDEYRTRKKAEWLARERLFKFD